MTSPRRARMSATAVWLMVTAAAVVAVVLVVRDGSLTPLLWAVPIAVTGAGALFVRGRSGRTPRARDGHPGDPTERSIEDCRSDGHFRRAV